MGSEYRNNFRAFSEYSYTGNRFTPSADVTDSSKGPSGPVVPWHNEVTELRKTANMYKIRGWGKETALPHLAQLYSTYENVVEKKIISALYLDNFQSDFLRRSRDQLTGTSSANSRQHSQPPPPQRNRPDRGSSRLDNHRRPKSAQNMHPAGGDITSSKEITKTWKIKRSESARHSDTTDSGKQKQTKQSILEQRRNQEVSKSNVKRDPIDKEKNAMKLKKWNASNGNQNSGKSEKFSSPDDRTKTKKTNSPENKKQIPNGNNKEVTKKIKTNIENKKAEDEKLTEKQKMPAQQIEKEKLVGEQQQQKDDVKEDIPSEGSKETNNDISLCNGHSKSQFSTKVPLEPTRMRSIDQPSPTSSETLDFTVPLDSTKTLVITQSMPDENGGTSNGVDVEELVSQKNKVREEGMSASFYHDEQNGANLTGSFIVPHQQADDNDEDSSQLEDVMKEFGEVEKMNIPKQDETSLSSNSEIITEMNRKNSAAEEEYQQKFKETPQVQNIEKSLPEVSTLMGNYVQDPLNLMGSNDLTSSFSFTSETKNERVDPVDSSSFTFSPDPVDGQITGLPPVKFSSQNLFSSSGVDTAVTDKPAYRVI